MVDVSQLALLILPITLLMLGGAFLQVWFGQNGRHSALWYSASFLAVGVGFILIVTMPNVIEAGHGLYIWLPALFGLTTALIGLSITQTGKPANGFLFAAVLAVITISTYTALGMTVSAFIVTGEVSCLIFYALGIYLCRVGPGRTSDKYLFAVMIAGAAVFLVRIALFLEGFQREISVQTLLESNYLVTLQFFSSLIIIGGGLSMLAGEMESRFASQRRDDLTDPLSGLLTRRGFYSVMPAMIERARSEGLPLSLILLDIDHFKDVNDNHGHTAGDRVICAFGGLISEASRGSDLAGRMGGEEFALLLVGADEEVTRRVAERMRRGFMALQMPETQYDTHTTSLGLVNIPPNCSFEEAYKRADDALYLAKRSGRNRYVEWSGDMREEVEHSVPEGAVFA